MSKDKANQGVSRRGFLAGSAAAATFTIVPRNVLGGPGNTPPSEEFGGALIGCGGQGGGTFKGLGPNVRRLASCDVKYKDRADDKTFYTDYRKVLERQDIDLVAIATPPGWHALISIAAMEAGKDVLCEKPMTRFISEGRAVAEAEQRYGRIYQIGTYGRFGGNRKLRKYFESGLMKGKQLETVIVQRGGKKVKQWSGKVQYDVKDVPASLDWDMYCGPAPHRPYNSHRTGGTHRGYWDLEGGGLADMAHHQLDRLAYEYGRDLTSPVEVTPHAPPQHPEACGLWGWCELKYADGFTIVLDSGEWGKPYDRLQQQKTSEGDIGGLLSEAEQKRLGDMPDPEPLVSFPEAIRTRKQAGGHAEASHNVSKIYHLANVSFRTGRTLRFDPNTEQIVGDEEANRLVNQPMRGTLAPLSCKGPINYPPANMVWRIDSIRHIEAANRDNHKTLAARGVHPMASAELKQLVDQLPSADGRGMYTTDINKEKIEATIAAIHKGGRDNVLGLIDMLAEPGSAADVKPRYALHCLANHTLILDDERARKELCEALASQLAGDRPGYVKAFLCQELGWAGRRESVSALGELLTDPQLSAPAAMALVAIRDGAAEQFRAAWPKAKDTVRRHIMDGLAALAEPASLESFKKGIDDDDREIRIAASAGLAELGDPTAAELLIKAADAPEGWERIQAARNCLLLAEKLAAKGNKAEARRVYEYLKKSRKGKSERHLQDAAERGLAAVA